MSTLSLTPAQHAILTHAIEHTGGRIEWFPDTVRGSARKKVLDGLLNRALVTQAGDDWFVAAAGYDALGRPRPQPTPKAERPLHPDLEADVAAAEASWTKPASGEGKSRTRAHSKQAQVLRMLRRPQGATIRQICEATGWQAHTVRGTFAGAFKKKLGLTLVSEKPAGGERVYRIVTEDAAA